MTGGQVVRGVEERDVEREGLARPPAGPALRGVRDQLAYAEGVFVVEVREDRALRGGRGDRQVELRGAPDVLRLRVPPGLPHRTGGTRQQREDDGRRQGGGLVEQTGQHGDAAVRARIRAADHRSPPGRTGSTVERPRTEEVRGAEPEVVGTGADGGPVGVTLLDAGRPDLQLHPGLRLAAAALEVPVEPAARARPGGVVQAQQAGELLGGVVAGAQFEPLGTGQPLVEGGDLAGVEDAVAPGVGQVDGRAVGVDPVHVRGRGPDLCPLDDLGHVAVGVEVGQYPGELRAPAAGGRLDGRQQGGGPEVPGLPAVQRVRQIAPTTHRRNRFDARVEGGAQQGQAAAQGQPHHSDALRVGRRVGQGPVDHRGHVGHVLRPSDIHLALREPEAAHGVGDGHVAVGGELPALGDVLQVVLPPTGGLHHHGVAALPVGAGCARCRGEHVGLEDDAVPHRYVDRTERRGGVWGGGGFRMRSR